MVMSVAWHSPQASEVSQLLDAVSSRNSDAFPTVWTLIVPTAVLQALSSSSITVTTTLVSTYGVDGTASLTVPLNTPPYCNRTADPCLSLELVNATFPFELVTARAEDFVDGQDETLRYEFGILPDGATLSSGSRLVRAAGTASAVNIVGLGVGVTTIYTCASDSLGAEVCTTQSVEVQPADEGFSAQLSLAAVDVSSLVRWGGGGRGGRGGERDVGTL
jgi:hypothetical protein